MAAMLVDLAHPISDGMAAYPGLPSARVRPVAWLCLGPVSHLEQTPDLERHGWRERRPWQAAVHQHRWSPPARP